MKPGDGSSFQTWNREADPAFQKEQDQKQIEPGDGSSFQTWNREADTAFQKEQDQKQTRRRRERVAYNL